MNEDSLLGNSVKFSAYKDNCIIFITKIINKAILLCFFLKLSFSIIYYF